MTAIKVTYVDPSGETIGIEIEPAYVGYVAHSENYDVCQDPGCECRTARINLTGWGRTPERAFEDLIDRYEDYA